MIAVSAVTVLLQKNVVKSGGKTISASSVMVDAKFKGTWRWEGARIQGSKKEEKRRGGREKRMKEGEGAADTNIIPSRLAEASLPSEPHTEDGSSSTRLLRDDDPYTPRHAIKQRAATPHKHRTVFHAIRTPPPDLPLRRRPQWSNFERDKISFESRKQQTSFKGFADRFASESRQGMEV
jgi:hypothetical protein